MSRTCWQRVFSRPQRWRHSISGIILVLSTLGLNTPASRFPIASGVLVEIRLHAEVYVERSRMAPNVSYPPTSFTKTGNSGFRSSVAIFQFMIIVLNFLWQHLKTWGCRKEKFKLPIYRSREKYKAIRTTPFMLKTRRPPQQLVFKSPLMKHWPELCSWQASTGTTS